MNFEVAEKYTINPVFGGNRDSNKPMNVTCRYLTAPEHDRVFKNEMITGGEEGGRVRITVDRSLLFRLSVDSFENCALGGREIKTVAQFNEARMPSGLYDELINEMISENLKGDLKN